MHMIHLYTFKHLLGVMGSQQSQGRPEGDKRKHDSFESVLGCSSYIIRYWEQFDCYSFHATFYFQKNEDWFLALIIY